MPTTSGRRLRFRMVATLALLGCTVLAAAVASGAIVLLLVGIGYTAIAMASIRGPDSMFPLPTVDWLLPGLVCCSLLVLLVLLWGERHAPEHAVAAVGAERLGEGERPAVQRIVPRVAQQLDVPTPTCYLAPTKTPLSMTTGYRPADAKLVVSEGLLDIVDEREFRAVVAHELAHVANRDAAVMTAAALPTGAAERVRELLAGPTAGVVHGQVSRADYADTVMTAGLYVVFPVWAASRALAASLSRSREFVADDGAVAVTGDPAALASALQQIDERLDDRPTTDFRRTEVAAFAIVEPARRRRVGILAGVQERVDTLLATHPPTEERIDRLRNRTREQKRTEESASLE